MLNNSKHEAYGDTKIVARGPQVIAIRLDRVLSPNVVRCRKHARSYMGTMAGMLADEPCGIYAVEWTQWPLHDLPDCQGMLFGLGLLASFQT